MENKNICCNRPWRCQERECSCPCPSCNSAPTEPFYTPPIEPWWTWDEETWKWGLVLHGPLEDDNTSNWRKVPNTPFY